MGHSQSDKLRTHERILDVAAKRFRERGLDGISISEIMQEVGITVGGFYKHFASREVLVSEAVSVAFNKTVQWNELASSQLGAAVSEYLSAAQDDDLASCTIFSCLTADIRRSNPATRDIFNHHLQETLEAIAGGLDNKNVSRLEDKATIIFAALVGVSLLARGTSNRMLSQKMLKAVKSEIRLAYLDEPAP